MFVNMLLLPIDMREILGSGSLNKLYSYGNRNGKIIDCFYQKSDLKNYNKETLVIFDLIPISSRP